MKNMFKILTLSLTALTGSALFAAVVIYDDAALASQIVCGQDDEVEAIAKEMIETHKQLTQETKFFGQNLIDENGGKTNCYLLKIVAKSKKQRQ